MDSNRPLADLRRDRLATIRAARASIEAFQQEIRDAQRQIDRAQRDIASKEEEINAVNAEIENVDTVLRMLKDQRATEEASDVATPRPPPTRQAYVPRYTPDSSSPLDQGAMLLDPKEVDGGAGWIDLVEDGLLLKCPWCKVNVSIRKDKGVKQAQYFKGSGGFISHMNHFHKEKFEHVTGAGNKKKYVQSKGRPLTHEERQAYDLGGVGVSIEAWVPFNEIYRGWLKQRKEACMRVAPINTPAAPIEDDGIVCRPQKRQKVEHTTEAGPSRSSATLGQASVSKRSHAATARLPSTASSVRTLAYQGVDAYADRVRKPWDEAGRRMPSPSPASTIRFPMDSSYGPSQESVVSSVDTKSDTKSGIWTHID